MNRLLSCAALALLLAASASAQTAPRTARAASAPDASARIAALASGLTLTADQQARLDAVAAQYQGQTGAAAAWAAAADVRAVLTEAQIASLRTSRGNRASARAGRSGDRRGADRQGRVGRGDRSAGRASRGADRQAARAVRADFAPRAEALRERLRSGQIDAAQFADEQRALRAEAEQRLDAARTPEQRQQATEARTRREAAEAARAQALGLTAQQQNELREIAAERVRLAPARPAADAARPSRDDVRARREAARPALEALRTRAEAVLTPEQKATVAIYGALTRGGRLEASARRRR